MLPRALITGGSRGIGAAIAKELARAGYPVILNYRRKEKSAIAIKEEIEEFGGTVKLSCFDVRDDKKVSQEIKELLLDPHPIGIIVNNAGIIRDGPFPSLSKDHWDQVVNTSLIGFYNVTHPLILKMIRERWGRIINISSLSGVIGNKGQVNYSAAKAGLLGITKSLAKEVASRNITVNAIAPGVIETDMVKRLPHKDIDQLIPMKRMGKPEDVAHLVSFLVSEKAGYITGQIIGINGGLF